MIILALIMSFMIMMGHFVYGTLTYTSKIKTNTEVNDKLSKAIFHYMSVVFVTIFIYTSLITFKVISLNSNTLILFGIQMISFGVVAFIYDLQLGFFKIFQWLFFIPLGIVYIIMAL